MDQTNSVFGTFSAPVTSSSTAAFGSTSGVFGGSFGQAPVFGSQNLFGSASSTSTSSFPVPPTTGGQQSQSRVINSTSSVTSVFGAQPLFGAAAQSSGGNTSSSVLGKSTQAATTASSVFGAGFQTSQPTNVFGSGSTFQTSSMTSSGKSFDTSPFGQTKSSLFSVPASSGFGTFQTKSTAVSVFGGVGKNEKSSPSQSSLFQTGKSTTASGFGSGTFSISKSNIPFGKAATQLTSAQHSALFQKASGAQSVSSAPQNIPSLLSATPKSILDPQVAGDPDKPRPTAVGLPMVKMEKTKGTGSQGHQLLQSTNTDLQKQNLFKAKETSSLQPKSLFGGTKSEVGVKVSPFSTQGPSSSTSSSKPESNLFGASQKSSVPSGRVSLFGKSYNKEEDQGVEQAHSSSQNSPRKTLSKWNRSRDVAGPTDRKRRESEHEDVERDPTEVKRSRTADSTSGTDGSGSLTLGRARTTRKSVEDTTRMSIIVKDIPAHLNKGTILRRHFSRFGTITRLLPVPSKGSANITFQSHEEAAMAKSKGRQLEKGGPQLQIFWRASGSSVKSPEANKPFRLAVAKDKRSPSKVSLSSVPEGSVEDELASMAGTADVQYEIGPVRKAPKEQKKTSREKPRRRSPTPPPSAPAPTVVPASTSDLDVAKGLLKTLWGSRAPDSSSKINVLDARDKLLRLLRGRQQSDLASAKAFAGDCPDLCPEKERYYREDIRRLALYEVIPETLSSLTGLKSEVDHYRAVKEYSRSSADQEEPLPHELRPLPVLVTTMTYLLTEVADEGGEGKWAEWYDFLWNRTRGIRKDITQQQLCDIQVAELLEKCARFHVFCSERLCEEDMMSFDAKINDENLTKCLQTLKELYADLENKQGVFCPNEAEFRGYMVLMKLNEGDILREVQQMRPDIRESAPILFAVEAYNALNSHNYVRFFRLIQRASFLNACILHRYFIQIRSQALRIIMKAHGALGKNKIMYPVAEMIRLLRFESAEEVEEFCYHYCLSVEESDVLLDAKAYMEPEGSLSQRRSQTLVEAKCTVSVGETINGCPLPMLILPTPSSSFDENGKFIISNELKAALYSSGLKLQPSAADLMQQAAAAPLPQQSLQEPQGRSDDGGGRGGGGQSQGALRGPSQLPDATAMARGRTAFSNEDIKNIARTVILEVIDTATLDIAREVMSEQKEQDAVIRTVFDDLSADVVQSLTRSLAKEVHNEEESRVQQARAKEMAEQRQRVFNVLCEDIVEDAVNDIVQEVAINQMNIVTRELNRQCMEGMSLSCQDSLLSVVTLEIAQDIAQEVFEIDVVAKRERLEETERCVQLMRCRRVFQFWRSSYLSRVRVKRAMLDFPSAPPTRKTGEQLMRLVPNRPDTRIVNNSFFINERARLYVSSPMDVIQQQLKLTASLSMASVHQMLLGLRMWQPLDIVQTLGTQLHRAFAQWREADCIEPDCDSIHWKLCMSVPNKKLCQDEEQKKFIDWLRAKLCKDGDRDKLLEETPGYQGEVLSLYHCQLGAQRARGPTLRLCVRCFHGHWNDTHELKVLKEGVLKGCTGVLFVTSPVEQLMEDQNLWQQDKRRLHQVLKQKPKVPAVPLVIILPRRSARVTVAVSEVSQHLDLEGLGQGQRVSAVHLAQPYVGQGRQPADCYNEWTEQLSNCLRFTASHIPTPARLRVKPVSDFVEDTVVEMYKAPVYQDLRTRHRHQQLHQSPNVLVSLYNTVIEHTAMVCASSSLTDLSWPSPEFDSSASLALGEPLSSWNSESHLSDLYELVSRLRLPVFRYQDLEAQDWTSVCQDVWNFVALVTKKDSGSAKISLHHQVSDLLTYAKKTFDQFCWLASEDGPCEPTYVNMAWTDLIDACIHYKLVSLRTGHLRIEVERDEDEEEEEEYEEAVVFYKEEELEDWEAPVAWVDALRDTETARAGQIKLTVVESAVKRDQSLLEASQMKDTLSSAGKDCHSPQTDAEKLSPSWRDLKERFAQERAKLDTFEQSLSSKLLQGPLPANSTLSPIPLPKESLSRFDPGSGAMSGQRARYASKATTESQEKGHGLSQGQRFGFVNSSRSLEAFTPNIKSQARSLLSSGAKDTEKMDEDTTDTEEEKGEKYELTLTEGVSNLQDLVEEQRRADRLFEMRLQRLMNPTPLL
ncbi:germinal-center associated nuclear protein [Aplysia californica]|uniref:Germinal-center associated nuclear protein n=1 Tax=Aplysia californica TaxID=6500 RepID=A0ABM0JJH5_APLCA|nr:germinal-center associated nuclear protein [Aplysia californica]